MASQVFLQAPFSPIQCSPTKLGFSSSCPASILDSRNLPLISRVSSTSISWRCNPLIVKPSFVVRADSNLDDAGSASVNVDEAPEEEGEQVLDSEPEIEEEKPVRKPRVKLGDVMGILHQRAIEASDNVRDTPDIRTGDVVQIKLEVPENKRRLSLYKGIVISKQNAGIHTTIRVRRIIAGTGVEITFPVLVPFYNLSCCYYSDVKFLMLGSWDVNNCTHNPFYGYRHQGIWPLLNLLAGVHGDITFCYRAIQSDVPSSYVVVGVSCGITYVHQASHQHMSYSPNIKEIKVVSHRNVRRAKLYYLKDKLPRFSTFK